MFSQELVQNSVEVFICKWLSQALGAKKDAQWFDGGERMDMNVQRESINGVLKAVSPITKKDKPTLEDLNNMKQVCMYVIYHSSFMHTWSNIRQYDDCGELRYCSLGIRWGKKGILVPESDDSVSLAPNKASEMMWISNFLTYTNYGHIMGNEDKDIHPDLITSLKKRESEFKRIGFDIYSIQSRPNI